MIERISNFCKSESQEKENVYWNASKNDDHHNTSQIIQDGPLNKLSMAATNRLQRAAAKSRGFSHPLEVLRNEEAQSLLRVKFLDCILREAAYQSSFSWCQCSYGM